MGIPDAALPSAEVMQEMANRVTQVVVMRIDGDQALTANWFCQDEFTDTVEKISDILGAPHVNAVLPLRETFLNASRDMVSDPDTKMQFG